MNRFAKFLSLAAFASVLCAAGLASAANETVTVSYIGCGEAGECFIGITPALTTGSASCNGLQVRFQSTQLGADYMYKTALAAYFAGKKLIINPSATNCLSGFPRVLYIQTAP